MSVIGIEAGGSTWLNGNCRILWSGAVVDVSVCRECRQPCMDIGDSAIPCYFYPLQKRALAGNKIHRAKKSSG